MKSGKKGLLFALGGGAYVGLEYLWRGRSHYSMFLAGGTCFLLLGALRKTPLGRPGRVLAGAGLITLTELGTGLIFNRDHRIWDYRGLPGNFRGQICPRFTALWLPIAAAGDALYAAAEKKLDRGLPE